MRTLREVAIPGREKSVLVKELTVGEIRAWLATKTEPGDVVDSVLIEDLAISDLLVLTDLDEAALESLAPSEIDLVVAAAKEINGHFFGMLGKMAEMGARILAATKGTIPEASAD